MCNLFKHSFILGNVQKITQRGLFYLFCHTPGEFEDHIHIIHFWKPVICRTWFKALFSSFSAPVTHPSWQSWCSTGLPVPTHVFSFYLVLRSGFCDSHSDTLTLLYQAILPPLWKKAWGCRSCRGLGLLSSWDGVSNCPRFCEFCAAPICPAAKNPIICHCNASFLELFYSFTDLTTATLNCCPSIWPLTCRVVFKGVVWLWGTAVHACSW